MTIHQLIYTSRAIEEVTANMLLDILQKSQTKNYRLRISGLLIFNDGKFVQLLEGGSEDVKSLFATIKHDPRHTDVTVVLEADSPERCILSWVMGFSLIGDVDSSISDQNFYLPFEQARELCELMPENIGKAFLRFFGD